MKKNDDEKDPELGGRTCNPSNMSTAKEANMTAFPWKVIVYVFAGACVIYALFVLLHVAIFATPPDVVTRAIDQIDFTHLMHARHEQPDDPLALVSTHETLVEDETIGNVVPYGHLVSSVFTSAHTLPVRVSEPCRRLSKKELMSGTTLEGYEIPLLLVRMCSLLHDLVGCDDAGFIIPKMIDTPDELNICIITFKEASGVCSHYINPTVRPVLGSKGQEVRISSPHFPFLGEHPVEMRSQGLLTYQPIVDEQVAHDANPSHGAEVDIIMSNALKGVENVDKGQWLSSMPNIVTVTLQSPRVYYFLIAHDTLLGDYPSIQAN